MITEQELDKGLFTLKIIWFIMLVSLAILLSVGLSIRTDSWTSTGKDVFPILRTILYIVSFVILFATRYVRKLILSAKGPLQHSVFQNYSTAMIVALAMSESIGIYGLILFFLGKNVVDLYRLILVSAAAMLLYRPKKNELLDLLGTDQTDSASGSATT